MRSKNGPGALRCRQINQNDIESIVDLLTIGFPTRARSYWATTIDRLKDHPTPSGLPKFGYLLEYDGTTVGVILLIFSTLPTATMSVVRCNVSSWYVEPAFRIYASLLVSRALAHKDVTYVNISPAPDTRATIEAQGFLRYCNGQLLALPLLSAKWPSVSVRALSAVSRPHDQDLAAEFDLLTMHARLGCLCLWCTLGDNAYPLAFLPRRIAKGLVPVFQLVYCRDSRDLVQFAGPIGRYLALRGRPLVLMDSHGPIRGLLGRYFEGNGPKYFKGSAPPRLGDLAFTEGVLFGP